MKILQFLRLEKNILAMIFPILRVGRGLFLPKDNGHDTERLCIFERNWLNDEYDDNSFRLLVRLPDVSNAFRFVSKCFEVFLNRVVHGGELARYASPLKSNMLTPREFIEIVPTSDEGLKFVTTLIISACPNRHMTKLQKLGAQNSSIGTLR
jgi:hypothetical protein